MNKEGINMSNNSKAMAQIIQLLGMQGMDVISFNLHTEVGKIPVLDVMYYLKDMPPIPENEVTQVFELIPVDKK